MCLAADCRGMAIQEPRFFVARLDGKRRLLIKKQEKKHLKCGVFKYL